MNLNIYKHQAANFVKSLLKQTSNPRKQLNSWLKSIEIDAKKVLEVGPSLNPVVDKVRKWRVKEYKSLDNNLEKDCRPDFEIDLNQINSSDKYGWIGRTNKDTKTIKKTLQFKPDVVFCLEVMEYIYIPDVVLRFFHDVLCEGGILYVSFHAIYPVHEPHKHDSLRYTKWGIINLLKSAGFKELDIKAKVSSNGKDDLLSFFKKEKMIVSKEGELATDTGYLVKAYK